MRRLAALTFVGALVAAGLVGAAGLQAPSVWAGEGKASPKKAKAPEHLAFQRSYGAALAEARIRNLPVFVSRHKDF